MATRKHLTIGDIAGRLGISKATVSKALSPHADRSDISLETRERVRLAAERLGWRPDERRAARARRQIGNIGLVCQRVAPLSDGVYSEFLDSLGMALMARGRRMLFVPALDAGEWDRLLSDQRIDGAVLMEPIGAALLRTVSHDRFPAVLINQETSEPIPQVVADDAGGAALAVRRLVEAGHRRLALARSPGRQQHYSVRERVAGFLAACCQLGVSGEDCAVTTTRFVAAWCAQDPDQRPTAVLCYNFHDTIELIRAAEANGVAVPGQLSVISGDDLGVLAFLRPPVTSLQVPMAAMAERTVARLCAIIDGQVAMGHEVLRIPSALAERCTVAPPQGE